LYPQFGQLSKSGHITSVRFSFAFFGVNERYGDVSTASLGLSLAVAFYQKHMEVRSHRLGVKLPHHHCDLTSMVSGVVYYMLHEVGQSHLRRAKGKRFF
jgi:hypothetical protein